MVGPPASVERWPHREPSPPRRKEADAMKVHADGTVTPDEVRIV
jgi:hypothetical protein